MSAHPGPDFFRFIPTHGDGTYPAAQTQWRPRAFIPAALLSGLKTAWAFAGLVTVILIGPAMEAVFRAVAPASVRRGGLQR